MESPCNQFQRRAIVGNRHFILADTGQPDVWALAGPVVIAEDENGIRSYGPAGTITTAALKALACKHGLPFKIEEKFPVVRRDIGVDMAA